ncbi:excalibur calcium-binding domain-containing protein [Microbacterium betulae]|uniref:Excalibur calcium-binding domain-containing protein n=1 Tax=Microbacterium betulae TaxID=2981139 RepID=A0AA97I6K2_9MICO|nr:hypothetical protein [Microbacterium sp. AB]WOF23232.1 excalibur calcium-binding domain-containing protein [Microbacterium sp. AB]
MLERRGQGKRMDVRRRVGSVLLGAIIVFGGIAAPSAVSAADAPAGDASAAARVLTSSKPTISGTVKTGQRLTAKPGRWTAGTRLRYQWFANGSAISGATGSTYVVRPGNVDRTITVKVTGSKSGYTTKTVASAVTRRVTGKVYPLCAALNKDYPDGIRKSGVKGDRERGVLTPFDGKPFVSDRLYSLQSIARDADRDGIMCER